MRWSLLVFATGLALGQSPEPVDAQGWTARALELGRAGKQVEALEAANAALRIDPRHIQALHTLAWLQFNAQSYEDARATYRRILTITPEGKEAMYGIAAVAGAQVETARLQARRKSGMRPEEPGPIRDAATRFDFQNQNGGNIDEAIANLERVLQQDPDFVPAKAYMGQLLRARADYAADSTGFQQEIQKANEWAPNAPSAPAVADVKQIRVGSEVQAAKLLKKVDPEYPPLAQRARIQGNVRYSIVVDQEGRPKNLTLVSGHPLLVPAATDALKQWVYQPTLLNGQPVEVTTQVDVLFTAPQ